MKARNCVLQKFCEELALRVGDDSNDFQVDLTSHSKPRGWHCLSMAAFGMDVLDTGERPPQTRNIGCRNLPRTGNAIAASTANCAVAGGRYFAFGNTN